MTGTITPYSLPIYGSLDKRDTIAQQIIRDIASLNISLAGKTIIDVGCRSGENMLAMQAQGATVIGIDPNDSEFDTAVRKGAKVDQLFKKTLQEFRSEFPEKKFDIATVFLWSFFPKDYEAIGTCLHEILNHSGNVIVGYAENHYRRDFTVKKGQDQEEEVLWNDQFIDESWCQSCSVPALLGTTFGNSREHSFINSLNRYVCIASKHSY